MRFAASWSRRVWRIAKRPARNVASSDGVGVTSEATRHTMELGLREPVGFIHATASRTRPAGVPGVHQGQRHSRKRRLVCDELAKLEEAPGMVLASLGFSHGYSLPNTA